MTLRLHDTATRSVRDFVPRVPGEVGIYLCGLTVQEVPHIGHLRSGVNYDVLRRWFLHSGHAVTFIRNVTDVDDKILERATLTGRPFWSIAYANEQVLSATYRALNVLPPTYEPRATGHVPDMHELIATLIAGGHAYPGTDDCGDVYFDVSSFAGYGKLSGQDPADLRTSNDCGESNKRHPADFALWKGVKADEPLDASWPSPWGRGRPGWHIECSAMARRYLGDEFDIHGGGLDLMFPHHENELAQSSAAMLPFARYWVHHGLLNLGESKMSKSLGNVIDLDAVVASGVRPIELRYYLGSPHYRSRIDYSEEALREAAVAYRRIEGFVRRASERVGAGCSLDVPPAFSAANLPPAFSAANLPPAFSAANLPPAFSAAMNDDLNTSAALAVVHDTIHTGNLALVSDDEDATREALSAVRAMLGVLGLDPLDDAWTRDESDGHLQPVVGALVALALQQREQARTRKDWAAADSVRDQLKHAGVQVEDTPTGPRWTVGSNTDAG